MFRFSSLKVRLIMSLRRISLLFFVICITTLWSCAAKKNVKFNKRPLPRGASIAVIIDAKSNLKNVVLVKFLARGFNVKAINASDLYSMGDVFDIKDMKKLSQNLSGSNRDALLAMERSYNNIYKLHFYNYEVHKAEILSQMREKWKVRYLVILDLKNWEEVSWGRLIDLKSYEILWIENYPTTYDDTLETVMDHFIASMTGKTLPPKKKKK